MGAFNVDHPPQPGDGYTAGRWGDFERYACEKCAFDSLEVDDIESHVQNVHVKPHLKAPGVLLYDADGFPVYAPKTIDEDPEE